jgi:hypothetical protein
MNLSGAGSAENPIIVVPKKLFNKAKKHFGFLPPKRNGTSPGDMLSGDTPDDCVSMTSPWYRMACLHRYPGKEQSLPRLFVQ